MNDIGSPLKGELYREETPGAGIDKTLMDREEIGGRTEDSGEIKEQKVLGLYWDAKEDIFSFKVKLNFSKKRGNARVGPDLSQSEIPEKVPKQLTRRIVLSQLNGFFDPAGMRYAL